MLLQHMLSQSMQHARERAVPSSNAARCAQTARHVRVPPWHCVLIIATAKQADIHAPWGGVVPTLAMEAHAAAIDNTVDAALADAGVGLADLDAVAVTIGPGLSLCLRARL